MNATISQKAITIMILLALTIVALLTAAVVSGKDTLPVIGACIAGPIVTLHGYAYLKTRETRKGILKMLSGIVILSVMGARMAGVI